MQKRTRGYILTRQGVEKLEAAKREWESQHGARCTQEKMRELTSAYCGAIQTDYECDIEAYWQDNQGYLLIERELDDLVKSQFDRLEKLDIAAYRLLCRLGCYRYQEIPSVPIDGVSSLLWDVPKENHKRVIKSLQDRSLVESKKGESWLHPVIREESSNQLNGNFEWKLANYQAIGFWLNRCKTEKVRKDHPFILQLFFHLLDHSFDNKETQIAEKIFGIRLVEREFPEDLLNLGNFHHHIGLIIQNMLDFKKKNIKYNVETNYLIEEIGNCRYNFEAAIAIFSKLGETEEAEKVKWAMEKGGDPYETALAFYKFGLNYQEDGELETSKWLFQMAIHLFKQLEAYEEAEEVRQAMESGE